MCSTLEKASLSSVFSRGKQLFENLCHCQHIEKFANLPSFCPCISSIPWDEVCVYIRNCFDNANRASNFYKKSCMQIVSMYANFYCSATKIIQLILQFNKYELWNVLQEQKLTVGTALSCIFCTFSLLILCTSLYSFTIMTFNIFLLI